MVPELGFCNGEMFTLFPNILTAMEAGASFAVLFFLLFSPYYRRAKGPVRLLRGGNNGTAVLTVDSEVPALVSLPG